MSFIKELINDTKHFYDNYGLKIVLVIYAKLITYLIILPLFNLFILWKVWWLGIIISPITYLGLVVALQGQTGVAMLGFRLLKIKNSVMNWWKK